MDAAAQVFAEYGYAAGTTNHIAECAEVSIGSLYQYFPNEHAVLRALMQAHANTGALDRRAKRRRTAREFGRCLTRVRPGHDRHHRDNPRLHRVLFEEAPRAPEFLDHVHEVERRAVELTAAMLKAHPSAPASGGLTAHVVVTTIESLVHRLVTIEIPVDLDQLEDEIVVLLGRYLRRSG